MTVLLPLLTWHLAAAADPPPLALRVPAQTVRVLAATDCAVPVELYNQTDGAIVALEPSLALSSLSWVELGDRGSNEAMREFVDWLYLESVALTVEVPERGSWRGLVAVPAKNCVAGTSWCRLVYHSQGPAAWGISPQARSLQLTSAPLEIEVVQPDQPADIEARRALLAALEPPARDGPFGHAPPADPETDLAVLERLAGAYAASPYALRARWNLASHDRHEGRWREAIAHFRYLLRPELDYPLAEEVRWQLAETLREAGEFDAAIEALGEVRTLRAHADWLAERWRRERAAEPPPP